MDWIDACEALEGVPAQAFLREFIWAVVIMPGDRAQRSGSLPGCLPEAPSIAYHLSSVAATVWCSISFGGGGRASPKRMLRWIFN
jgi:hypothetical protein